MRIEKRNYISTETDLQVLSNRRDERVTSRFFPIIG